MEWPGLEEFRRHLEQVEQREFDVDAKLTAAFSTAGGLECSIDIVVDGGVHGTWLARFDRVVENRLVVGESFRPESHRAHQLLLDHRENRSELYLAGPPSHIGDARSALLGAHATVMGDWRPARRYLNPEVDLDKLLAGGHGLLASGPTTLIRTMADETAEHVRTSVLEGGEPKLWNAERSMFEAVGEVSLFMSEPMWDHYPDPPGHRSYAIAASLAIEPAK